MKSAIIDIGSNTVRLGIVHMDPASDGVCFSCPEGKELRTVRLGQGLLETGNLQEASMERAVTAIEEFYGKARSLHLPVFAYATSAVRDAANRETFLSRLQDRCPVSVEVLDGETEGRLAYLGAGNTGTLLDIGGGSAQIVTAEGSVSQPTGCVRAKDLCPQGTPEKIYQTLLPWLEERWDSFPAVSSPCFGVGGTITTLGALLAGQSVFDGKRLAPITLDTLSNAMDVLYFLLQKGNAPQLLGQRRDVILQGSCILRFFMKKLSFPQILPIDRDGLEGYAAYLYAHGRLTQK